MIIITKNIYNQLRIKSYQVEQYDQLEQELEEQ
jgi:hypothetical protein